MNKKLPFFFFAFFSITSTIASDSFDKLYIDLVNFWQLGKHSVFMNDFSHLGGPYLTENKLDFYISDLAFFLLYDEINDNYYLSRNGHFSCSRRGFLVNEDGYYVLNKGKNYINIYDIDLEMRNFVNVFLLVVPPDNTNLCITEKYVITSYYRPITVFWVLNNALEDWPVSLDVLLEKALLEIDDNKDYEHKEGLIALFFKRYVEMREYYGERGFGYEEPDFNRQEYLENLLEKIKIFEQELLH